jgi:hypothetical protein
LCATGDAGEKGTFVSIIILNILFRQWSFGAPLKSYFAH